MASWFGRNSEDLGEAEKAVIGDTVAVDAIEAAEKDYKAKNAVNQVTDDDKFQYAWHLVKSPYAQDVTKGVAILKELCKQGQDHRDYLFFIAQGLYRLEDYEASKYYVQQILQFEPNNRQAKQLQQLIINKQKQDCSYTPHKYKQDLLRRDGLLGIALVGGTALVVSLAAAVVGLAFAKGKK